MDAAENDPKLPLTADLLAELQAGLLDDATAARVRKQIRDDPAAADALRSLNQVRDDVAGLLASPAPPVPPEVPARVAARLRSAGAAHSARPPIRPGRVIAAVVGLCAA